MSDSIPPLVGQAVTLRALEESDKDIYLRYGGQKDAVWGFGGSRSDIGPRSPEQAERWLRGRPDSVRWGIEVAHRLIGTVQLLDIDRSNQRASIAIGIMSASDMNRGYGTEAIRLIVRYGFDILNLHRIDLRVLARNRRAIRAYDKCGFVKEGVERDSAFIDGVWEDDVIMSVLSDKVLDVS